VARERAPKEMADRLSRTATINHLHQLITALDGLKVIDRLWRDSRRAARAALQALKSREPARAMRAFQGLENILTRQSQACRLLAASSLAAAASCEFQGADRKVQARAMASMGRRGRRGDLRKTRRRP